jgi:hypothetical protein
LALRLLAAVIAVLSALRQPRNQVFTWPLPLRLMTPRSSSKNGPLCRLFGDVTLLLVGVLHFGGDFHRHFCFGLLAGISDMDLQLSSLSKLHAAHGVRPFTHLPG